MTGIGKRKIFCGLFAWLLYLGAMAQAPFALAAPAQYQRAMQQAEAAYNREDVIRAMQILEKVARQGYAPAQVRLAQLLDYAEQDEQAVYWYRQAAQQGYADGQYRLGRMYAHGEGVNKSMRQAVHWIGKAAQKNHLEAVKSLAHAYQVGELGLPVDARKARLWRNKIPAIKRAAGVN